MQRPHINMTPYTGGGKMEMVREALTQLGLAGSEAKVYFALLELESSTVGPIIEKAGVPDSKIYSLLEKLKEKGLASYVIKNNVKHFQAANPERLVRLIEEREEDLHEQKRRLIERVIPAIEERRKLTEDKQEATVYESMAGLAAAFQLILDTLSRGEEYYVFMLGEELATPGAIRFFNNFHAKRVQRGIAIRLLSHKRNRSIVDKWHNSPDLRIRYTSQKLPVGTFVFKDHIMTIVWGEKPTAFLIKSRKNYEHYREFFEDVWGKAS